MSKMRVNVSTDGVTLIFYTERQFISLSVFFEEVEKNELYKIPALMRVKAESMRLSLQEVSEREIPE